MGGGKYQQVGSASDVSQLNQLTQPTYDLLGQTLGLARQNITDPMQQFQQLQGMTPEIAGMVGDWLGPYNQSAQELASNLSAQAAQTVANQWGGNMGGPLMGEMAKAASVAPSQAAQNIAQMQAQMAGGLGQQLLGQMGQQNQLWAGLGQQALGGMTGLGENIMYTPTYAYQKGFGDYLGDFGGMLMGAAAAPLGGMLGQGIGNMFSGGGANAPQNTWTSSMNYY
jgi:hypothetical protein